MSNYLENFDQERLVIYTVIMGDYDYLKDPEVITPNCDYICFTNNRKLKSTIWDIRYDDSATLDNTKWQRRHKVMAHEYLNNYQWSVYVDGNVRIIGNMRDYIINECNDLNKAPILCLQHPDRNSIYSEAEECIKLGKDNPKVIKEQMEGYHKEGYLGDNGLVVSNVLVRKHMDQQVIQLMKLWWKEIEQKSRRDQLSFNYVCWKMHLQYNISEFKCWKSPYWLNPGIHTSEIRKVEEELIEHIGLDAYLNHEIVKKNEYIALKEQELQDLNTRYSWKEQELRDLNTRYSWKEQELQDLNTRYGWKEQELLSAQRDLKVLRKTPMGILMRMNRKIKDILKKKRN